MPFVSGALRSTMRGAAPLPTPMKKPDTKGRPVYRNEEAPSQPVVPASPSISVTPPMSKPSSPLLPPNQLYEEVDSLPASSANIPNGSMPHLERPTRPCASLLSPDLGRTQKSASPAFDLVGRVLREQGLGRHIDDDFIAAATAEMQEAMNMSPQEFEAAAAQLLAAEREGSFRMPGRDYSVGLSDSMMSSSEAASPSPLASPMPVPLLVSKGHEAAEPQGPAPTPQPRKGRNKDKQ